MREWFDLALAGVPTGCIASLSGIGLVLTYRATGVFNFAHGAIAMFVAFLLWQFNVAWGWPLYVAATVAVFVCAPAIGLTLERVVFRPLQRRGASTSEKLVATLGIFVLLTGVALQIWTGETKTDAPRIFKSKQVVSLLGQDDVAILVIVLVSALGLFALFRWTHLGTQFRAVVDKRELSELSAVNANRVAAIAWAMGCTFAGLTGVLLAPTRLDPYRLTLLVLDTFAVAVIAKLRSLPLAVAGGIGLGVVQSLLGTKIPEQLFQWGLLETEQWPPPFNTLPANLLTTALFVFLLVYRRLDEIGATETSGRGLVANVVGSQRRVGSRTRLARLSFLLVVAAAPLILPTDALGDAAKVMAFYVIFLSIVVITGFSGHITLGQAGFAGLGAYLTARLANGQVAPFGEMPVLVAMLLATLVVLPVGLATGYPALKRKGLFLGLTTLAVGLVLSRFVFDNLYFTRGGVVVERPELFGLSLAGDQAFYWYAAVLAGLATVLANNLRSGRLGRILGAMRDSEVGAQSVGLSLRKYKLFIFAASACLASIGGTLLSQQTRSFNADTFSTFQSLFLFTAIVVAGLSYLSGAAVAAVLFVVINSVASRAGVAEAFFGLGALFLGFLPGGIVGSTLRAWRTWPARLRERWRADQARHEPPPALSPSEFGTRVLQDVGR